MLSRLLGRVRFCRGWLKCCPNLKLWRSCGNWTPSKLWSKCSPKVNVCRPRGNSSFAMLRLKWQPKVKLLRSSGNTLPHSVELNIPPTVSFWRDLGKRISLKSWLKWTPKCKLLRLSGRSTWCIFWLNMYPKVLGWRSSCLIRVPLSTCPGSSPPEWEPVNLSGALMVWVGGLESLKPLVQIDCHTSVSMISPRFQTTTSHGPSESSTKATGFPGREAMCPPGFHWKLPPGSEFWDSPAVWSFAASDWRGSPKIGFPDCLGERYLQSSECMSLEISRSAGLQEKTFCPDLWRSWCQKLGIAIPLAASRAPKSDRMHPRTSGIAVPLEESSAPGVD